MGPDDFGGSDYPKSTIGDRLRDALPVEMRLWWFYCECGIRWSKLLRKCSYTDHVPWSLCPKCSTKCKGGL